MSATTRSGPCCAAQASALKKPVRREQARPTIAWRRRHWKKYQGRLAPRRLVFIDETWAKTNMTPIRDWSPRGQKLVAHALFVKWRTLIFVAALRHDRIDAPCVLDGPINGVSFTAYAVQFLVRRSHSATSSAWTIWVARKARPSARRSALPAQNSCSCRHSRQT